MIFFRVAVVLAILVPFLLYVSVNMGGAFQSISGYIIFMLPPEIVIPIYLLVGYAVYSFISSFIPD